MKILERRSPGPFDDAPDRFQREACCESTTGVPSATSGRYRPERALDLPEVAPAFLVDSACRRKSRSGRVARLGRFENERICDLV